MRASCEHLPTESSSYASSATEEITGSLERGELAEVCLPERPADFIRTRVEAIELSFNLHKSLLGGPLGLGCNKDLLFKTLSAAASNDSSILKFDNDINRDPRDFGTTTNNSRQNTSLLGVVAPMVSVYEDHYRGNLGKILDSKLKGWSRERAKLLLAGNLGAADAMALDHWSRGILKNKSRRILDLLSQRSLVELTNLKTEFRKHVGETLEARITRQFSQPKASRLLAAMSGDQIGYDALQLSEFIRNGRRGFLQVASLLKRYTDPEHRLRLNSKFLRIESETIESKIRSQFTGLKRDLLLSYLEQKHIKASAIELRLAITSGGKDVSAIKQIFQEIPFKKIGTVLREYKAIFGTSFELDTQAFLSNKHAKFISRMLSGRSLTSAEKIFYGLNMQGETLIWAYQELQGRSREQLNRIGIEYRMLTHNSLRHDVDSLCSGRDKFRLKLLLEGRPVIFEQYVHRLRRQSSFERSGGLASMVVELLSRSTKRFDRQIHQVNEALKFAKMDGEICDDERLGLIKLIRFSEQDLEEHIDDKRKISELLGSTVSTALGTVVVLAGTGMTVPLIVCGTVLAGAVAYVSTKAAILGRAYDSKHLVRDGIIGALEGLVAGLGAGVGSGIGGQLFNGVGEQVTKEGMGSVVSSAMRNIAGDSARDLATKGVSGGLGGVFGSTLFNILRRQTWEQGIFEGVKRLAISASANGITSATGAAMHSGGVTDEGWSIFRGAA